MAAERCSSSRRCSIGCLSVPAPLSETRRLPLDLLSFDATGSGSPHGWRAASVG
jgi:hypothetical protein